MGNDHHRACGCSNWLSRMQRFNFNTSAGSTKAVTPVAVAKPPAPPPDRPLTRDEVRELQQLFKKQGFNVGPVDGLVGPRTRLVMQTFAKKAGLVGSTEPTLHLLEAARARKN